MDAHLSLSDRFDIALLAAQDRWCARPIIWGEDDCLMSLAAVVREVKGIDLAASYRGRYGSPDEAIKLLGKGGVPLALSKAAKRLHWGRLPAARCQSGALGFLMTPIGPAGVMRFRDAWMGRVDDGVGMFPSDLIIKAWGYE